MRLPASGRNTSQLQLLHLCSSLTPRGSPLRSEGGREGGREGKRRGEGGREEEREGSYKLTYMHIYVYIQTFVHTYMYTLVLTSNVCIICILCHVTCRCSMRIGKNSSDITGQPTWYVNVNLRMYVYLTQFSLSFSLSLPPSLLLLPSLKVQSVSDDQ